MTSKNVHMIVAVDSKMGFSKDGNIPWKIQEDLNLFKKITTKISKPNMQNALIMGRKTALTLKGPLPNRFNFVISNNKEYIENLEEKGFECFSKIEDCLKYCNENENKKIENIFLIGGFEIYNWGLSNPNQISKIHISHIMENFDCDLFLNEKLLNQNFRMEGYKEFNDFSHSIYSRRENHEELAYLKILRNLINKGHKRQTRNAITYSSFGKTLEFDLSKSFPLLTTKKMAIKSIFEELKFFLLGRTDNKILKDKNVHIWNGNTTKEFIDKCKLPYEENDMGPMYGYQWRFFNAEYKDCHTDYSGKGCDQLTDVINLIKTDPFSRRILMTSYNPAQSKLGVLYPCHGISIQFYVEEIDDKMHLDCLMHQRSADSFLGVPFNITSYAMLVHILCNHINCTGGIQEKKIYPGKLLMVFGDVHIYDEHIEAVKTQISRESYLFPQLHLDYEIKTFDKEGRGSIGQMEFTHLKISDYKCHEPIKAKMIA
jgi:dihydrofolate reductase/thymidylate synthase